MDIKIENLIIYLRKSRSDDPAQTVEEVLAKHERILQDYCIKEYGKAIPEKRIYREVVSGETIQDRPVMQEVMSIIESNSVQGVLVVEPQRLSRGDLEDCGRIINGFRYTSTFVITPQKKYNLSDEYDRKFFEMELSRGNDYLEYTKKILNRGRVASVKQGNFIGSIAPYGYKKVKIDTGKDAYHTLDVNVEEANVVKIMYDLFVNKNYGFKKIATYLDDMQIKPRIASHWSPAAIKDMLENPVYIGKIRWNWRKINKVMQNGEIVKTRPKSARSEWIYVDGKHEAIIDIDTYNAALAKRGTNVKVTTNKELSNPFAGLLFCGTCGRAMSLKRYINKRTKTNTVCLSMVCDDQSHCHTRSVQYSLFVDSVIKTLKNSIEDFEIKIENDNSDAESQQRIVKSIMLELRKLKEKDTRQKDALDDGIYSKDEFLSRNAKVQEQIYKAEQMLKDTNKQLTATANYKNKIIKFANCINAINDDTISAADKNALLKSCIEKIVYNNNLPSAPGIGRYVKNKFELDLYLKL